MLGQDPRPRSRAWLLRCRTLPGGVPGAARLAWRCTLEDPHTGERREFDGPEPLVGYVQAQLAGDAGGAVGGSAGS